MSDIISFLFGLTAFLLIVILAVMAGLLEKPAHEDDGQEQRDFDDARLDTIRDELEDQTAPNRPHIRSLS